MMQLSLAEAVHAMSAASALSTSSKPSSTTLSPPLPPPRISHDAPSGNAAAVVAGLSLAVAVAMGALTMAGGGRDVNVDADGGGGDVLQPSPLVDSRMSRRTRFWFTDLIQQPRQANRRFTSEETAS